MNVSTCLFVLSSIETTINYQSFNVIFRTRPAWRSLFLFHDYSKVKSTLACSFYFHAMIKDVRVSSKRFYLPLKCTYTFFPTTQRLNALIYHRCRFKKKNRRILALQSFRSKWSRERVTRQFFNESTFLPIKKRRWSTVHSLHVHSLSFGLGLGSRRKSYSKRTDNECLGN